jgi:hypothetical protein
VTYDANTLHSSQESPAILCIIKIPVEVFKCPSAKPETNPGKQAAGHLSFSTMMPMVSAIPSTAMFKLTPFFFDYCSALIGTAVHAYVVGEDWFVTLRTTRDAGQL